MPLPPANENGVTATRIEKRCMDCAPPPWLSKVPAICVSTGVHCDACGVRLLKGAEFWAVVTGGNQRFGVRAGS